MQLISRKVAATSGLKTYFTGDQCKHGHIAPRYVLNGACSECVKLANYKNPEVSIAQRSRRIGVAALSRLNLRAFSEDYPLLAAAAFALAVARCPQLQESDVDPHLIPKDRQGGTGMYALNCHPDDEEALRAIAMTMLQSHTKDMGKYRQQSLQAAQTAFSDQGSDRTGEGP